MVELQNIFPVYQPVISITDGMIYGYEVLGRQSAEGEGERSLGPFFHDETIPSNEKRTVDRRIRRMAFEYHKKIGGDHRLFINLNPHWIYERFQKQQKSVTFNLLEEVGLDGSSLVIEITEEQFNTNIEYLAPMIKFYQDQGCLIAIDDFTFENFDRLIYLKPDLVKMDIALLKKSVEKAEYKKLIYYISHFAQELGITVLFEGVENEQELEHAIWAGGSLVQGYYFSPPAQTYQDPDVYTEIVGRTLKEVIWKNQWENRSMAVMENAMNEVVLRYLAGKEPGFAKVDCNIDLFLTELAPHLPEKCWRLYVCDGVGAQLSSNHMKKSESGFLLYPEYKYKNWGWRPYFFDNLSRMRSLGRGVISNRYVDMETRRETLTFSCPLGDENFLFVDFYL